MVHDGDPLTDAEVTVEALADGQRATVHTDSEGVYRFPRLLPGSYRLSATTSGVPVLGSRSGKNPILLAAGQNQWIGLQAVPRSEPAFRPLPSTPDGFGSVSGTVRFNNAPAAGAVVDLYLDDHGLRGPGFRQSFPAGADGLYVLDEVPEGAYYVVARRRASGTVAGPLVAGDLYGEALANPVPVRSRQETLLDVHLVRKERDDDPNADRLPALGATLRGVVVDGAGTPVPGLYVFAYRNRVVGHGMPDFRTLPGGPDGSFALSLGEGGLFYVGAREHAGGSPQPGEWFGFYEGSADHGITVRRDQQVEGVRIVVRKVLE
ncbi:MAG: carboxypeptidase-like regulatory domain-containing protein [Deferrisomatales bacterium]|nr:carboxypeptidase-like regulatory domain-containing protein [Deferrisomatales bacterium]